ncbi:MAG: hypothetical protein GEV07_06330 [Streptosporangiales bacterium]|nr:hypothetical protein [Streptosporangiales bacterium]
MADGPGRPTTPAGGVGPRIAACALIVGVGVLVALLLIPGVGNRASAGDRDEPGATPTPVDSKSLHDFGDRLPAKDRTARLADIEEVRIPVDGVTRKALVYIPSGVSKNAPAFVAVHGYTSSAQALVRRTSYVDLAERNGWILAMPQGRKYANGQHAWNAGTCCGGAPSAETDDVKFIDALAKELVDDYGADRDRLFYHGYSNGAMLGYKVACRPQQPFRAFAFLSGTLVSPCTQSSGAPILAIHGLRDGTVPYVGSRWRVGLQTKLPPVLDSANTAAVLNGCRSPLDSSSPRDRQVRVLEADCPSESPVELVTVSNMTHQWTEDGDRYGLNETRYSTKWLLAHS